MIMFTKYHYRYGKSGFVANRELPYKNKYILLYKVYLHNNTSGGVNYKLRSVLFFILLSQLLKSTLICFKGNIAWVQH